MKDRPASRRGADKEPKSQKGEDQSTTTTPGANRIGNWIECVPRDIHTHIHEGGSGDEHKRYLRRQHRLCPSVPCLSAVTFTTEHTHTKM
jgi:hypothetical protein